MEYIVARSIEFDAGHHTELFDGCDGDHGHHYVVTVELASKVDIDAAVTAFAELEADLEKIKAEVANRPLNLMVAPADPTLVGLASFVWMRLVMDHPALRKVTVVESTGRTITVS
jgi:6-pyruvoyl-tetrahydropterin synthase